MVLTGKVALVVGYFLRLPDGRGRLYQQVSEFLWTVGDDALAARLQHPFRQVRFVDGPGNQGPPFQLKKLQALAFSVILFMVGGYRASG
jgi:hypothetical protein